MTYILIRCEDDSETTEEKAIAISRNVDNLMGLVTEVSEWALNKDGGFNTNWVKIPNSLFHRVIYFIEEIREV